MRRSLTTAVLIGLLLPLSQAAAQGHLPVAANPAGGLPANPAGSLSGNQPGNQPGNPVALPIAPASPLSANPGGNPTGGPAAFPPSPQAARIEAESPHKGASAVGIIGDEAGFILTVRLIAPSAPVPSFQFLPYELKRQGGDEVISRQQLTLLTDAALPTADQPRDFQIRIARVPLPGSYEGEVRFRLPGQPLDAALRVPVVVTAKARTPLTPITGSERVSLELVRCTSWLDCWLARRLLPDSARIDRWQLLFDNPSMAPVTIEASQSTVKGNTSGFQLTRRVLQAGAPQLLGAMAPSGGVGMANTLGGARPAPATVNPPGSVPPAAGAPPPHQTKNLIVAIPLFFNRIEIPADSYAGTIMLMIAGQPTRTQIEFNLKMRDGPLWPFVLILCGILLGRLFKYMQGRGGAIAKGLDDVDELEYRVKRELSGEDVRLFEQFIDRARKAIVRDSESQDIAAREVELLRQRLRLLAEMTGLESQVRTGPATDTDEAKTQRGSFFKNTAQIRAALRVGNDKGAASLLEESRKLAEKLLPTPPSEADLKPMPVPAPPPVERGETEAGHTAMGLEAPAPPALRPGLHAAAVSMSQPPQPPGLTEGSKTRPAASASRPEITRPKKPLVNVSVNWSRVRVRVKNALITVSGASDDVRAQSTRWLVRPMLSLILLLGLTLVGIQSLYVEKGATFGATRFGDYFGLLLWGLSADVASRNLSNLRGGAGFLASSSPSPYPSQYPPGPPPAFASTNYGSGYPPSYGSSYGPPGSPPAPAPAGLPDEPPHTP